MVVNGVEFAMTAALYSDLEKRSESSAEEGKALGIPSSKMVRRGRSMHDDWKVRKQIKHYSSLPTPIMAAIPPLARSKNLRACLLCSLIQVPNEFKKSGCPNCEEILQVRFTSHSHSSCSDNSLIDERFCWPHRNMYNNAIRWCYCCHWPRPKLGG